MTDYIVRIELHSSLANYTTLHNWMHAQKFRTTITGSNGLSYKLPTATYEISSARDLNDLRDWLVNNLPDCGSSPKPWILVVKSAGAAWRMGNAINKAA